MQIQDIGNFLGLQGVRVKSVRSEEQGERKEAVIEIEPSKIKKTCPCCGSEEIIRNGCDGNRRIKHLRIAGTQCILEALRQRLLCKNCGATHTHEYDFVDGKERYTRAYKAQIYQISVGSTVQHGAEVTEEAYSTAERFFREAAMRIAPLTLAAAVEKAQQSTKLILGIDDFAIRKGHNYNTGIHDLRGENLIGIVKGRTLEELREYMKATPELAELKPFAIVMDLAQGYHTFAAEFYPNAIRVADRFHVNRYILDALNEVRRRVCKELAKDDAVRLKRGRHILNKRKEDLGVEQLSELEQLLKLSPDLKAVHELKEQLIEWYDCSSCYNAAKETYLRWLSLGLSFNIPEVTQALKTFENWKTEILNYHLCPFTNGIVEGKNAKIKALQRRHFFLRNRSFYEALIIIECNKELSRTLFHHMSS